MIELFVVLHDQGRNQNTRATRTTLKTQHSSRKIQDDETRAREEKPKTKEQRPEPISRLPFDPSKSLILKIRNDVVKCLLKTEN
jgi:hypothetical protein